MAQIMPKDKSWGETIGEGLGQGIGSGFQALANMKMQDYAARQAQTRQNEQLQQVNQKMVQTFGPQAEGLAWQPPQVQAAAIKGWQQQQAAQSLQGMMDQLHNMQNGGQNNQQPMEPGTEQQAQPVATQPQQGLRGTPEAHGVRLVVVER